MPVNAAKARITVIAGVLPNVPMYEHTKQLIYTSLDLEADRAVPPDQPTRFSKMLDEAYDYAKGLSNPQYVNWVSVTWMWF